jgi:hypothetical protein
MQLIAPLQRKGCIEKLKISGVKNQVDFRTGKAAGLTAI